VAGIPHRDLRSKSVETILHFSARHRPSSSTSRRCQVAPRVAAYGADGGGKTFDDAAIALYLVYVEGSLLIVTTARESRPGNLQGSAGSTRHQWRSLSKRYRCAKPTGAPERSRMRG
jgi:hypothetical protein